MRPLRVCRADSVHAGGRYWYLDAFGDGSATRYPYPETSFTGAPTYVLRYKLPAGVTCDRCVLQW